MARLIRSRRAGRRSQRGIALVLIVVGLAAILLMAALALDVGHMTLNKTYLQNATDAAALAAAKALDDTNNTLVATAEGRAAFCTNAQGSGYPELASSYTNCAGQITVTLQYSATLAPFVPGAPKGPYVRVIATGFDRPTWFATIAGITQARVAATAVAGPSPTVSTACDIVPMMVCGDPAAPPSSADPTHMWGYTVNDPVVLKRSAPGGTSPVGPGNFQLISLGGTGANVVRQNLAGGYTGCASIGDVINTQPGNEAGPVAQGLNTRFGDYQGPVNSTDYPPDVVVVGQTPALQAVASGTSYNITWKGTTITAANIGTIYNYAKYNSAVSAGSYDYPPPPSGIGRFNRRIVSVPVGDCSGSTNGRGTLNVLGFACFFLLDRAQQSGNDDYVFGQFVGKCPVTGVPGPNPGSGPAPYLIQLYRDPDSGDS